MIDLETLGQEPGSVIVTLNAVQFDLETGRTGRIFEKNINIKSCEQYGLKIDPGTALWWMDQNDAARSQLVDSQINAVDLNSVLLEFASWLRRLPHQTIRGLIDVREIYVWGRGPRFDMALLSYAYKAAGFAMTPWDFRKECCVRTMEMLEPEIKKNTIREGVEHNGVDDAKHQIKYVSEIYRKIKNLYRINSDDE
jgi:exodeoxyribonuclease VIII